MPFEIILAPEAMEDLDGLKANVRATVLEGLETHLRHEPTKTSRSRIKRLKKMSQPQYRLRMGDVRVFYDVTEERVEVLAVVLKSEVAEWLANHGKSETESK
ncbi:MAG: type II toxin-antitoxin system RelE family toxin [Burkholderiales bacterium]